MSTPKDWVTWYRTLPIPWLVGGDNGQAEGGTWPSVLDGQVTLLKEATKARFPDYAPSDALPHIGGDRVLLQGPTEADDDFGLRIKAAWDDWSRAGNWPELLSMIYWGEFSGFDQVVAVQQNGLAMSLSAAPTAGEDPTALLTIDELGLLGTPLTPCPGYTKVIPAGNPWWTFDSKTDFCSRFALLILDNPDLNAEAISRLGSIIRTWRRGSQTCVGVYVLITGYFWDWPVRTWAASGTWATNEGDVLTINGTWQ